MTAYNPGRLRESLVNLFILSSVAWTMLATSNGPGPATRVCTQDKNGDCTSSTAPEDSFPPTAWCSEQPVDQLSFDSGFACGDYLILGAEADGRTVASNEGVYIYVGALDSFGYSQRPAYRYRQTWEPDTEFYIVSDVMPWPAIEVPGLVTARKPPSGWLYVMGLPLAGPGEVFLSLRPRHVEDSGAHMSIPVDRVGVTTEELMILDIQMITNEHGERREGSDIPQTTHGVMYFNDALEFDPAKEIRIRQDGGELAATWSVGPDKRALFFTVDGYREELEIELGEIQSRGGLRLEEVPEFPDRPVVFSFRGDG